MATARAPRLMGRDMKRLFEEETFRVGLAIFAMSKKESPVGRPRLWKVNIGRKGKLRRPPGYVGGTFRRMWRYVWNPQRLQFVVGNPMPYAQRLTRDGHSKQVPKPWWVPMVNRVIRKVGRRKVNVQQVVLGRSGGTSAYLGPS